jgi:hypothetical protein
LYASPAPRPPLCFIERPRIASLGLLYRVRTKR